MLWAFRKLTDNDFPLSVDPDEVFKVWPTNADRNVFRSVMRAESAEVVKLLLKETDEAIELQAAGAYDLKTSIAAPGFVRASRVHQPKIANMHQALEPKLIKGRVCVV